MQSLNEPTAAPGQRYAIEAEGLVIGYAGKAIGGPLDLQLEADTILCLLGPNGSGKTTLFKTLMGLIPALAGRLRINNKPVEKWSRRAFAQHVGYVPQAHDGVFPFTVKEVVLMGRSMHIGRYSVPGRVDHEVAEQCLQRLNITPLQDKPYNEISGGERQLTLIARALAQEPQVLIMDEPTASLDFGNQIRVLEHIRQLKRAGMAVLLSTHQPEHAMQAADRVALFRDGAIQHCGPPRQTMLPERLAWLYDLQPGQIPKLPDPGLN
ncbi:MAG TPA: ABC transporter ATP-binding protein [Pusillimonas sp.]|uniref:ABC transporter ATP-binding protein n=1 Tax=Pusillimonas sp. TaxID=3040095 RepID=UPI002C045CCA|nr:ABC transporter ATP-binding protein [Pusillimonas sp.]HUH87794.1 ABC transporter ATP-binding protein [Pusillimonas sp.]